MSPKLLAHNSCYYSQRHAASFLIQQIRARVLDMQPRQARGRGRGRGRGINRGESIQHNMDGHFLRNLSTQESAVEEANLDSSNNCSQDGLDPSEAKLDSLNSCSQDGLVGVSSQIAVVKQSQSKGSFGGLSSPASALGETKADIANTNLGHYEAGCSRGSLGLSSNPASLLVDTKPDSVNTCWSHNNNAVRRGSNARQDRDVATSQYQGSESHRGLGGQRNEPELRENHQILESHEARSYFDNTVGRGRNARYATFTTTSSYRGSGSSRGWGGHGRRSNKREPSEDGRRINALGRTLVRILRHGASDLGFKMRDDGYVEVTELLQSSILTNVGLPLSCHTIEDFYQVVKQDNKQRLGIIKEDEKLWIRANQGHSLEVIDSDKLLKPIKDAEEIQVCVHGTYTRFLSSIMREGLKTMGRRHVHFATGLPKEDGVISGMRKTCDVLIYLDVAKALSDNMKLYMSDNGVILTEGFGGVVPPEHFAKIIKWPEKTQIPIQTFENPES